MKDATYFKVHQRRKISKFPKSLFKAQNVRNFEVYILIANLSLTLTLATYAKGITGNRMLHD